MQRARRSWDGSTPAYHAARDDVHGNDASLSEHINLVPALQARWGKLGPFPRLQLQLFRQLEGGGGHRPCPAGR